MFSSVSSCLNPWTWIIWWQGSHFPAWTLAFVTRIMCPCDTNLEQPSSFGPERKECLCWEKLCVQMIPNQRLMPKTAPEDTMMDLWILHFFLACLWSDLWSTLGISSSAAAAATIPQMIVAVLITWCNLPSQETSFSSLSILKQPHVCLEPSRHVDKEIGSLVVQQISTTLKIVVLHCG